MTEEVWDDLRRTFEPRYQLRGLLGRGGMGVVVEAFDPILERLLAIKVLSAEALRSDPTARERLQREARAAATLDHPNVVNVFGVGETSTLRVPYILMQRVAGRSLERRDPSAPLIDVATATRILGDVAGALTVAHARGLIHRDLKPSNVVVDAITERAIVLDFGISHWVPSPERKQDDRLTGTGAFVGTPHYMSPEQATGEPLTDRADIYSLGCMIYELLTGRPVFEGSSPMAVIAAHINILPTPIRNLRPDIPDPLARVLTAMLAKRPADRPSADDLRRRFATPPDHHPWTTGVVEAVRRRIRMVVLSGAALAALSVVQYGVLTEGAMVTLPVLQSGILGATVLTLVLYAIAGLAVIVELRRAELPGPIVQLIAGDWGKETGLTVDGLRDFAGLGQAERREFLGARRARGLAALSVGPGVLLIVVLLIVTPASAVLPGWVRWSVLLAPVAAVFWTLLRHASLAYRLTGLAGLLQRPSVEARDRVPFFSWAAQHRDLLPTTEDRRGWGASRFLALIATIATAVVCVALLGAIQFVTTLSRNDFSASRASAATDAYREVVRLSELAPPVARPLSDDSTRLVWDSLFLGMLDPVENAAGAFWSAVGRDTVRKAVAKLGITPRPDSNEGVQIMGAAYRGLDAEQRRMIAQATGTPRWAQFRAASRAMRSPGWERTLARSSLPLEWLVGLRVTEGSITYTEVRRQLLAAALLVDQGRADSAEALLWEVIQLARLQADGARSPLEVLRANATARLAAGALQVIYTRQRRVDRLLALVGPTQGAGDIVGGTPRTDPPSEVTAKAVIRDPSAAAGVRWGAYRWFRSRSCTRAQVLLGGGDAAYDSIAAFVLDSLARNGVDSAIAGLIDGSLFLPDSIPVLPDGTPVSPRASWPVRMAQRGGKALLAGCLNSASRGAL